MDEELNHPVVSYVFHMVEYIKNVDPVLFKRASEYAQDITGVEIDPSSFDGSDK
jgi:hypothetical protein